MGSVRQCASAVARHDYQCQGELLRRLRRFGVFREYIDARTRVASDGAKLLPTRSSRLPMSKASEASIAVVAVGGLFAVFAAISRKGRGAARVVKEGYGATDSTVDALLA